MLGRLRVLVLLLGSPEGASENHWLTITRVANPTRKRDPEREGMGYQLPLAVSSMAPRPSGPRLTDSESQNWKDLGNQLILQRRKQREVSCPRSYLKQGFNTSFLLVLCQPTSEALGNAVCFLRGPFRSHSPLASILGCGSGGRLMIRVDTDYVRLLVFHRRKSRLLFKTWQGKTAWHFPRAAGRRGWGVQCL